MPPLNGTAHRPCRARMVSTSCPAVLLQRCRFHTRAGMQPLPRVPGGPLP